MGGKYQMKQTKQVPENIDEFLKALATALLAWQGVESNLFLIFNFLVAHPIPAVLSAVYHSVLSINTHRQMVDAAAAVVLNKQYFDEWKKLSSKIKEQTKYRNHLAHFGLTLHTDGKGEMNALLTSSIFDARDNKYREYGIEQIREWNTLFNSLIADLSKFLDNFPAMLRAQPI